jgi:hypothetical protein
MTQLDLFGSSLTLVIFSVASDGGVSTGRQQYKYRLALPHARTYPTSRLSDIFSWLGATTITLAISIPIRRRAFQTAHSCRIPAYEPPLSSATFRFPLIVPPVILGRSRFGSQIPKKVPVASACRSLQEPQGQRTLDSLHFPQ